MKDITEQQHICNRCANAGQGCKAGVKPDQIQRALPPGARWIIRCSKFKPKE